MPAEPGDAAGIELDHRGDLLQRPEEQPYQQQEGDMAPGGQPPSSRKTAPATTTVTCTERMPM